jgi:hypothetical protein
VPVSNVIHYQLIDSHENVADNEIDVDNEVGVDAEGAGVEVDVDNPINLKKWRELVC